MRIPDEIRKCVGFVCFLDQQTGEPIPVGSMFFLGREQEDGQARPVFAVTARHVIDNLAAMGVERVILRLNLKPDVRDQGLTMISMPIGRWFFHPTDRSVDVAITELGIPQEFDHLVFPMGLCLSPERIAEHEIGLGDEVVITGLFRHHIGSGRNIPVVRVGNLAAMDEEPLQTRTGPMKGYLVEAQSIGGLSGSPVFVNLGVVRLINRHVRFAQQEGIFFLAGLTHGHFDELPLGDDKGRMNTGMAIVVPYYSIVEVIAAYERAQAVQAPR